MKPESFLNERVLLYPGDCLDVLPTLEADSIDSVVTDPPYGLKFMGKGWDHGVPGLAYWQEVLRVLRPGGHLLSFGGTRTYHRMTCAIEDAGFEIRDQIGWVYGSGFPKSRNVGNGWGTALKPAWEPICLARKPLVGTVAANVLAHGTGALNIDKCRVGTEDAQGRWPANVIHDGSEEVLAGFPDVHGAGHARNGKFGGDYDATSYDIRGPREMGRFGDEGSAARFFYTAKADADDRLGSKHPTVKPLDLMQWLVRLVTPKGGIVLDPFAGTGTTGEAAWREGMTAILIERELEYFEDTRRRMRLCLSGPDERRRERIKVRNLPVDNGPLFG